MERTVSPAGKIEIGVTGAKEIVQNVAVILATRKGSVPLDREFGTSWHFVDRPTPKAAARIRNDIVQTLARYEPRAGVGEIRFTESKLSALTPVVKLTIQES